MATPKVITGVLSDIEGRPPSSTPKFKVRLSTPAWITGGDGAVIGELEDVPVNPDGTFSLSLYSNGDLTPANTYYQATVEDSGRVWRPAIVVPQSAGPFTFPSLIVSSPAQPAQYVVGPAGPAGAAGPTGSTGPQGPAGAAPFVFNQTAPSASWTIAHNLGHNPSGVTVMDSGGEECEGALTYIDANTTRLDFSAAFAGVAYLE